MKLYFYNISFSGNKILFRANKDELVFKTFVLKMFKLATLSQVEKKIEISQTERGVVESWSRGTWFVWTLVNLMSRPEQSRDVIVAVSQPLPRT